MDECIGRVGGREVGVLIEVRVVDDLDRLALRLARADGPLEVLLEERERRPRRAEVPDGIAGVELLGEVRTPLTPRETQMVNIYRKLNVKMRRAFMYVGMAMAGEVEEDEEPMRKSADWDRPTVNRDPVKEMNDRAAARGEKRPDLDRLAELGVELGREPRPDAKSLYPGPEVHARIEPVMKEVFGE